MNFKITNKQALSSDIKRLDVIAESIAQRVQQGQYVIVRPTKSWQRIPLTVVESDPQRGTISLIFQETDQATKQLGSLQINDEILNILGPLGRPAVIQKVGVVVCLATGIGTTQILPICRAHRKVGNKVIGIIGAKTRRALMLEAQMRLTCNEVLVATNDGSYMKRGLATDVLRELLKKEKLNLVYAVGSVDMMQAVAAMTREKNIPTRVNLNPIILDGTGQCGACRVVVNNQTVLACVDGPEFEAHQVDFEYLKIRMNAFEIKKDADGEEIECFNRKSIRKPRTEETGILPKFLSGIRKNRL